MMELLLVTSVCSHRQFLPQEVLPDVWPLQEEPPGHQEGLRHPGQRRQRLYWGGRAQVSHPHYLALFAGQRGSAFLLTFTFSLCFILTVAGVVCPCHADFNPSFPTDFSSRGSVLVPASWRTRRPRASWPLPMTTVTGELEQMVSRWVKPVLCHDLHLKKSHVWCPFLSPQSSRPWFYPKRLDHSTSRAVLVWLL